MIKIDWDQVIKHYMCFGWHKAWHSCAGYEDGFVHYYGWEWSKANWFQPIRENDKLFPLQWIEAEKKRRLKNNE